MTNDELLTRLEKLEKEVAGIQLGLEHFGRMAQTSQRFMGYIP